MGLLDQKLRGLLDYIQANTPRNTRQQVSPGTVFDQGLINPNQYNAPAANRFKDSALGLGGIIPGVGDYASGVQAADFYNRGETGNAVLAGLGALPLVPAIGGMFIGKGAKTWDALKAQQAEEMLAKNIDPREVWKQTGTLKGVDGALRQEIPDNAFSMKTVGGRSQGYIMQDMLKADNSVRNPTEFINKNPTSPLTKEWELAMNPNNRGGYAFMLGDGAKFDDVVSHDLLSSAYPEVSSIGFSGRNAPDFRGAFSHADDGSMGKIQYSYGRGNISDWDSTTLHELQHAIQQREGWARGGNTENASQYTPEFAAWEKLRGSGTPAEEIAYRSIPKDYDAYRRLAGEAEARLTQSRMGLDAAQRLEHYPYDAGPYGFDVPPEQQIVRGLLDGPAMSYADEAAQKARQPTQYELAHQVAQKNAVDMLGLPPNNTAMDRARAMGFDTPAYHSSLKDINEFNATGKFAGHKGVSGVSVTDNPDMASRYLDRFSDFGWVDGVPNQPFNKNVMPLLVKEGNVLEASASPYRSPVPMGHQLPENYVNPMTRQGIDTLKIPDSISRKGAVKHSDAKNALRGTESIIAYPKNVRSRFAAFDPARRDSADLLAGVAPYAIPAIGAGLLGAAMMPNEAMAAEPKKAKKK